MEKTASEVLHKGKIAGVNGPVVDVAFAKSEMPKIRDELYVMVGDEKRVMEVAQHISGGLVRCIMLGASEGIHRDMEVVASGSPIRVPVGECVLGRLFDALGNTMDEKGDLPEDHQRASIYRPAPTFAERKNTDLIRRNLHEYSTENQGHPQDHPDPDHEHARAEIYHCRRFRLRPDDV